MPGAIRFSGTYVMEEKKIKVQLWLARQKQKTHVVMEGSAEDISALATKIAAAVLDAGKGL